MVPVEPLHHVELRADHRLVAAQPDHPRRRRGRPAPSARWIMYSRPMSWALLAFAPAGGRRRIRSRRGVPQQVGQVRGAARELPDLRRPDELVAEGRRVLAQPARRRPRRRRRPPRGPGATRRRCSPGQYVERPRAQPPVWKYDATARGRPAERRVRRDAVQRPVADGGRESAAPSRRRRRSRRTRRSTTSHRVPPSPCSPSATQRPCGTVQGRCAAVDPPGAPRRRRRVRERAVGCPDHISTGAPVSWE